MFLTEQILDKMTGTLSFKTQASLRNRIIEKFEKHLEVYSDSLRDAMITKVKATVDTVGM